MQGSLLINFKKNKKNVSESILEKALLEAEQLEETMKSNAKEILSSTMKGEIQELVKESLEDDYLKEQEEEEVDVLDIDDEMPDVPLDVDVADVSDVPTDIELDVEDETVDDDLAAELPPLDLTLASDAEVLKVFKAMGDEDGIIIQQDGDEIDLTDTTTNTEYIIKLDEEKKLNKMKKVNEMKVTKVAEEDAPIDMGGDKVDPKTGEVVATEEAGEDVVYEIELSEDDESEADDDVKSEEVTEGGEFAGDQGGDDYSGYKDTDPTYVPKSRGRVHGDQGGSDYSKRREQSEGDYGFDDHLGHSEQGYLDREADKLGAEHGHEDDKESLITRARQSRGTRKFDTREASQTLGFGRKSGGKHKPSFRKAITNNRNLGESRIRKSYNLLKEEVDTLKVKNADYKKALTTFRDKLNEVGVFNSNLAYVTRLFTEHSTTKQEKINILKRFDSIESLKSSKELYKVIKEELSQEVAKPTKTISESVESKITKSPTSGGGGKLLESKVYENPQFSRMKDLMSKL